MKLKLLLLLITSVILLTILIIKRQEVTQFLTRIKNRIFEKEETYTTRREQNPIGKDIYGIDVSNHQGKIEWSKVREWKGHPIQFVYIKATEGETHQDKSYARNLEGARKNGLRVGSYHYFKTTSTVEAQFQNFIKQARKEDQDLIPMVDVEEKTNWSDQEFHRNLQAFLDKVEAHYGVKPIIYAVNTFYNQHLAGKYKAYHFLIGRHGSTKPVMRDQSNWTIWQFSQSGQVDGISKAVDIDVLSGKFGLGDLVLGR